jgi:hypothetical protein
MITRQPRDLRGREEDTYIIKHESVPYGVSNNSRYKHVDELTLFDGKTIKATPSPIDLSIIPSIDMKAYTVPKHMENRIDLIALNFYGLSSMYWPICYMNNIEDPLDLPAGKILFIPSIVSLRQFPNPLS